MNKKKSEQMRSKNRNKTEFVECLNESNEG